MKSHAIVKALAASAHEPEQAQLDLLRSLHGDGIRTFNCLLIGLLSYSIAGMRALLEAFEDLRTRLSEATDRNKYFLTELERLQTDSAYSKTLLGHLQVCVAH